MLFADQARKPGRDCGTSECGVRFKCLRILKRLGAATRADLSR